MWNCNEILLMSDRKEAFFSFSRFLNDRCRLSMIMMNWKIVFIYASLEELYPKFIVVVIVQLLFSHVQLCDSMNFSMPSFPVLHCLPEFVQVHVRWFDDAIQPSYPLSPPFPLSLTLSQHQGLFQWVSSSYQVAKVLELQHQSFQWIFRKKSFQWIFRKKSFQWILIFFMID